jgi:hypothetical protein
LILKHDQLVVNVAYKFNMRRYSMGLVGVQLCVVTAVCAALAISSAGAYARPLFSST